MDGYEGDVWRGTEILGNSITPSQKHFQLRIVLQVGKHSRVMGNTHAHKERKRTHKYTPHTMHSPHTHVPTPSAEEVHIHKTIAFTRRYTAKDIPRRALSTLLPVLPHKLTVKCTMWYNPFQKL